MHARCKRDIESLSGSKRQFDATLIRSFLWKSAYLPRTSMDLHCWWGKDTCRCNDHKSVLLMH